MFDGVEQRLQFGIVARADFLEPAEHSVDFALGVAGIGARHRVEDAADLDVEL